MMSSRRPGEGQLLDTSIIIALARREPSNPSISVSDGSAISVVTLAELYRGVYRAQSTSLHAKRMESVTLLERSMDALPVTRGIARTHAEFMAVLEEAGMRPSFQDSMIAATAATHGLTLITRDRDFERFPDLDVVVV